ncbi:hypothetical protein D7030_09315 [Flavobacteriaceae bacterium AU392]|nr:hypothetical protein D1817_15320 [Flavobacteriaceae bacterium]RKM84208.1 hypothetical protein D7030_09315 [Flavobacteriaceae bacterium AU392]
MNQILPNNHNNSIYRVYKLFYRWSKNLICIILLVFNLNVEAKSNTKKYNLYFQEEISNDHLITDSHEKQIKHLKQVVLLTSSLVLLLSIICFIKIHRCKTFKKEQELACSEIYRLILDKQAKLEEGRKQERNRISEELHDGALGRLFGVRMGLGFLNLEGDETTLNKLEMYLDEMQILHNDLRDLSHKLKLEEVSKVNFKTLIHNYTDSLSRVCNFNYELNNTNTTDWNILDNKMKLSVYRIVQEALQNIIKHSKADKVIITSSLESKILHLNITDNGKGFNVANVRNGIGLNNINSRIARFKGEFNVKSTINKGTSLTIKLPTTSS